MGKSSRGETQRTQCQSCGTVSGRGWGVGEAEVRMTRKGCAGAEEAEVPACP